MGVLSVFSSSCRFGVIRFTLVSSVPSPRLISVRHLFSFRGISYTVPSAKMHGLVLGAYTKSEPNTELQYTPSTEFFNTQVSGKLTENLTACKNFSKDVKQRLFYNLCEEFPLVSVVNLGEFNAVSSPLEYICEKKENIRAAIAYGVKSLVEAGADTVVVDYCEEAECVAEAANLVLFSYDELKDAQSRKPSVTISLYHNGEKNEADWAHGIIKSNAQKFAMTLMEAPSNFMTPKLFSQKVAEKIFDTSIELKIRDRLWIEGKKMGSFLSVAKGSQENPLLIELHYNGGGENNPPVALVGKGITFDSGGISLKPSRDMDKMRSDMGGGAVVASTIYAAALLGLKVNVKGIIPLCENMPGRGATKPGDVVFAMNGKSIQVDNTDAEGRLILADALLYAQDFNPALIVDLATLTGSIRNALGSATSGAFTNAQDIFELLKKACYETGDRVWQMPLFKQYTKCMKHCQLADLNNIGNSKYAGACTAAAFLKEFVGDYKWIHIDIAGVTEHEGEIPYLPKGMSGRPTRTMIEFLKLYSEGD